MIMWGSFLVGGLVFGGVAFLFGMLVGILGGRVGAIDSVIKKLKGEILNDLNVGESLHFEALIEKSRKDEDDGDGSGCDPLPEKEFDTKSIIKEIDDLYVWDDEADESQHEPLVEGWTPENN